MNSSNSLLYYLSSRDRGWVFSLLLAVCLVYLPFLGNTFIFDDLNFFNSERYQFYTDSFFQFDLRWFPYATLAYTYAIFSNEFTYPYHLGNALLHAGNVILLFYFLRKVTGSLLPDSGASKIIWGAWFGALIFAVHPVAVYAVGYVIQRSILMAVFFGLLVQLSYLHGLLSGQKRWLVLAVLAYFFAVYSKEHSVLMPAVLAAMTVLYRGRIKVSYSAQWMSWLAFLAIAILITLASKGVIGKPYEGMAETIFQQQQIEGGPLMLHFLSVLTQTGLFFKYLFLWIVPNPAWMSIDMRETFVSSLFVWQGWLGLLGFVLYGGVAVRLLFRGGVQGIAGFALLYPWLLFGVEMASVRVQEPFVLYRSYMWTPGVMLLLPLLFIKFSIRKEFLIVGCLLLLIPISWNRLWVFSDNYRLWNEAALLIPNDKVGGAARIFYNRGHYAARAKKWSEAIPDYEHVTRMMPFVAVVHNDLGVAYFNTRRYQEALVQFDSAIVLNSKYAHAYFNKGLTLKRLKQNELSMQSMEKSCALQYATACAIVKFNSIKK